jgi:hypothetical protein
MHALLFVTTGSGRRVREPIVKIANETAIAAGGISSTSIGILTAQELIDAISRREAMYPARVELENRCPPG